MFMFIKCFNSAKQASKVDEDKLTGEIAPKILHPTGENIVKISTLIAVILTSLPRRQNTVRATGRQKL